VPTELHIDPDWQMQRFKALASDRANWMSYWEDISRYCAPRRMGFVGKRTDGDRRQNQIFTPSASTARRHWPQHCTAW
jgi:hypothetical protein